MAMRRMKKEGSKKQKSLSKPTDVFRKHAKKSEPDDTPGKMGGGPTAGARRRKKLAGMMI